MFKWFSKPAPAKTPEPAAAPPPAREADAVPGAGDSPAMPASSPPGAAAAVLHAALEHHQHGRLAEAEAGYREVLALAPEHIDALHFLGVIAHQRNDREQAVQLITRSLARNPDNAPAHNNLGTVLAAAGRLDEAIGHFQRAAELAPGFVDAHVALGDCLQARGRLADAAVAYRRALALSPTLGDAHFKLGNILLAQHALSEAAACYRKAVEIRPDHAEAWSNLGNALLKSGQRDEAEGCYRKAVALQPRFAEAHNNLGEILKGKSRIDEAITSFRTAIALKPGFPEAHFNLGNVLLDQDKVSEAAALYETAIRQRRDYAEARWALVATELPAVYDAGENPDEHREDFAESLDDLLEWFDADRITRGFDAVRMQTPFYLAYQEWDNRALLEKHASLCTRILGDWQRRQNIARPAARRADGRIHVGIVSNHLWRHSVWEAILKGWFEKLDANRFALHAFYPGKEDDAETRIARARSATFTQGSHDLRQWAGLIAEARLDVLIFPEIGMDTLTGRLACLRLADVQVTTWGHPQTSGLPTIDHYLSAEYLEPGGAAASYSESLELLPNLGCCFSRDATAGSSPALTALGIDPRRPFLLCPGTPFKYAPRNDSVFVKIAQRLPRCQLVFFDYAGSPNMTAKLRRRLRAEFAKSGLDFDAFAVFAPWQTRQAFLGLLGAAGVYLDTIGFSGFNTAMQAIERDCPVVTRDGQFLRGRLASGILKRIGMDELVVQTDDGYVDAVARLVEDDAHRRAVVERIRARRDILFDDEAPIRALEAFLQRVASH